MCIGKKCAQVKCVPLFTSLFIIVVCGTFSTCFVSRRLMTVWFLYLVLWAFAGNVLSNWWGCLLNLLVFQSVSVAHVFLRCSVVELSPPPQQIYSTWNTDKSHYVIPLHFSWMHLALGLLLYSSAENCSASAMTQMTPQVRAKPSWMLGHPL